jgi:predicted transcriptional regulator
MLRNSGALPVVPGTEGYAKIQVRTERMRFFKSSADPVPPALGPLEIMVMEILWARGESSVHDVVPQLARPLAYTTVMTTLDRLFKKGLLDRRKSERAFVYVPRLSRRDWEHKRTGEFVAGFLSGPKPSGELLISCLVEAVSQDKALLDELERRIRKKREELYGRGRP